MGQILDLARKDAKMITSEGGFETETTFVSTDGQSEAIVFAICMKHHMSFDTDGEPINSENNSITVHEDVLNDESFPVRINGEVNLLGCLVTYADSTGTEMTYRIAENYPDETLGIITLILSRYAED